MSVHPWNVRCKFECVSVTKYKGWGGVEFMYSYKMQPVSSGSPENKQFYASTPNGTFEIGAVRDDLFEAGKEYYFDITPAAQPEGITP